MSKTAILCCAILVILAIVMWPSSEQVVRPVVVPEYFSYMDNPTTDHEPVAIDPNIAELFWVIPGGTKIGSLITSHNGFWIEESAFRLLTQDLLDAEIRNPIDLYLWY